MNKLRKKLKKIQKVLKRNILYIKNKTPKIYLKNLMK